MGSNDNSFKENLRRWERLYRLCMKDKQFKESIGEDLNSWIFKDERKQKLDIIIHLFVSLYEEFTTLQKKIDEIQIERSAETMFETMLKLLKESRRHRDKLKQVIAYEDYEERKQYREMVERGIYGKNSKKA